MKKIYALALGFLGLTSYATYANPGDTTWVQANIAQLSNYAANYDTAITFPDGSLSYRKVLMYVTIGEYPCPAGSQYCHQWDYTVLNYILTPTDTIELSRLITPYANSGVPRFPSTWEQVYTFDVTDFYPILKNAVTARTFFSGYSGGFTLNVKYAFIEGTPDRNITGIKKLYQGSYAYGDATNPINDHFPSITETAPAGTQSAAFRFLVTGHGADTLNNCCEFDIHSYDVMLNGTSAAHRDIWRDNCGMNQLYPQGGTWIFNRANWCPGALVEPIYNVLPGITAGTNYNIQLQFSPYTATPSSNGFGSYTTSATVIYYGDFNKTSDASIDDIIAPTNNADHFRENPNSNAPIVKIHNSGSTVIDNVTFEYGVKDSTMQEYKWTGTLAPLADTIISLSPVMAIKNIAAADANGTYTFIARISKVNDAIDEDATNDTLRSQFTIAPLWPGDIKVTLKSTNITTHPNGSQYVNEDPSEASWDIKDMQGNKIASRENTNHSTVYDDVVALPSAGFYKFTVYSAGCDGLNWWPYNYNGSPVVPGYVKIATTDGTSIPMDNYNYTGMFHDDFGCEYSQYFYVAAPGTSSVQDIEFANNISIYPNPANDYINITLSNLPVQSMTVSLVNVLGQTIYSNTSKQTTISIHTADIPAGIYTVVCTSDKGAKKTEKVVIAH